MTVRAGGGLVWRRFRGVDQVLLVHRPAYDDWSLPKGKLDDGEAPWTAAVREVEEETSLRCEPGADLGTVSYRDGSGRPKVVHYWQMRAPAGQRARAANEVDDVRWARIDEAVSQLSYVHDRDVVRRLRPPLEPGEKVTIDLVRHAKAGDRSLWTDADSLRPLTRTGRAQAAAIAKRLGDDPPAKILSSPATRCVETVEPLAERVGLVVQTDDLLAEGADATTAMTFLSGQAVYGTLVACTHGDVMMLGVERLLDEGVRLRGAKVDYKKGCTWRLTVVDGVYTAARYVPPPKGV